MSNMDNKEKDKNRVLYITHKGELLIWLIVLLIAATFFISFYFTKIKHNTKEYRIYMPDVDGLIVGSPVRMMGIEVGHVTKIKPVKNEVFIRFILHDDSINLPQGTSVTVEFSGMAGSKSLELYLPEKNKYIDSQTAAIEVNPPKRLSDVAGLLNEMFKEVNSIIKTSAHFGKELKKIDMPKFKQGNNGDIKDFIKYSDGIIDQSQKRMEEFGRKLNYGKR